MNKVSNIDNDQDGKKIFEFEFFTGGTNQKFDSFVWRFGISSLNLEFYDFLQWDYCKEILENNDLKINIETGNIYCKNNDTNESIFDFMNFWLSHYEHRWVITCMYDCHVCYGKVYFIG